MKRKVRIVVGIFGAIAILAMGGVAGSSLERYNQDRIAQSKEQVDVIAVVNMDEGITDGEEQINYASQLMEMPGDNYVTTGLNEAKMGIENGSYAAYIIIPEDFSESIASVESNPEKVLLEYTFNPNLDEEAARQAISDVNAFEATLNTNVAYMYVDAIMTAFHDVQDDASTILRNDAAELGQLQDVQANELIIPMEQPEMKQVESAIEPVNLSPYLTENTSLLENMTSDFDNSIRQGMDEFALVQTGHEAVEVASDTFFTMYGTVLTDTAVNNSTILADGKINLEEQIALFNEDVESDVDTMETRISEMVENQRAADELSANQQSQAMIAGIETEHGEEMQGLQDAWQGAYTAWNSYAQNAMIQQENTLRTTWQSQIDGSLSDMLKLAYRQGAEDALANVEQSVVSSMNSTGQDVAVSYIATDETGDGLGDGITDDTGDGITDGTGDGITDGTGDGIGDNTGALTYTAADIQNVCAGIRIGVEAKSEEYIASQGDFIQIQLTDESVGASTFELSNATDEEGNPVVPPTIEENNRNAVADINTSQDSDADPDINLDDNSQGIVLETAEVTNGVAVTTTAEEFAEMFALQEDRQAISDLIQTDFLEALTEEGKTQMGRLADTEETMGSVMEEYERSLLAYDPFTYLDTTNMTAYLNDISTNSSEMLTEVEKNNLEYMEYADEVYMVAMENEGLRQTAYSEATTQTAGNVETCMEALQASRANVNSQNTEMLENFSVLLPYTRVGSQGNPEVYEHIVNPVASVGNDKNTVSQKPVEEAIQISTVEIVTLVMIVSIVVCMGILLSSILRKRKAVEETGEMI